MIIRVEKVTKKKNKIIKNLRKNIEKILKRQLQNI